MSIHQVRRGKQAVGYCIRWYDLDGRERQRTIKGITREEAVRLERDLLAKRDRGEPVRDLRTAPLCWPRSRRPGSMKAGRSGSILPWPNTNMSCPFI